MTDRHLAYVRVLRIRNAGAVVSNSSWPRSWAASISATVVSWPGMSAGSGSATTTIRRFPGAAWWAPFPGVVARGCDVSAPATRLPGRCA